MGEAVECEGLTHEKYNVDEQLNNFIKEGGELSADRTRTTNYCPEGIVRAR